jgi:hypothetical protein
MTARERALLEKLLEADFPGRDALVQQSKGCLVRNFEDGDNYGAIEFHIRNRIPANVVERVPVEGRAFDIDGVPIDHMLHVLDGLLTELDVVKASGTPIERFPDPQEMDLFVRGPIDPAFIAELLASEDAAGLIETPNDEQQGR